MVSMIENQSLTDLTTSFCVIAIFILSMLPANIVNEMDPVEASQFPNYLYIYFMHLVMPFLMAGLVITIYFFRNKHFRKTTLMKIHNLVARHF